MAGHGRRLYGVELAAGGPPSDLPAPDLLVSVISASAEPVVLFTDGPLTNLAAALRLDPGMVENIAMVFTMGGALDVPGNNFDNPDAEWNIWADPTAAAEVFASGVPLTLVPLDATNQVPVHLFHVAALREHQTTAAVTATVTMLGASEELRAVPVLLGRAHRGVADRREPGPVRDDAPCRGPRGRA